MKKTPPVTIIPSTELVLSSVKSHTAFTSEALATVSAFQIETTDNYTYAVESLAEVKSLAVQIEAQRKSWVDPLNGVVKSINEAFRGPLASLTQAERLLKEKIVAFVNESAVKRDKLIQEAGARAQVGRHKAAAQFLERAEEKVVPRIDGVQMRTSWTGEVADVAKIPREYMIPDVSALKAATKGGDPHIPGWRAFPETIASINTAAVFGRADEEEK